MSNQIYPVTLQSPPPAATATVTKTRRVPPPCWSKEETLALVEAYKEIWFALRRGNLKAPDWDAVSAAVSSAADSETTKSSVQCRHKIEKLRKRYRSEKQRIIKNPGRLSSWDLYPLLDSMNFASTTVARSDVHDHKASLFEGSCMNGKDYENVDGNSGSNLGFCREFNSGYGSKFDLDHKFLGGNGLKLQGDKDLDYKGNKFKSNSRFVNGYRSVVGSNHSFGQSGIDSVGEFPLMALGDQSFMNLESKNHGNSYLANDSEEYSVNDGMGFEEKVSDACDLVPQGFGPKKCVGVDGSFGDYKGLNGSGSCSRPVRGRENSGVGMKRCMDPLVEIVSSIKFLAERFMRMERMKMETVKEIEQMRIEMEMKHNEMIFETHHKIVNEFAKTLLEKKKRKKKPTVLSPEVNGNRVEESQESDQQR